MEDRDITAAAKLAHNLIANFEGEDALQFASLVLARVCHDARLPLQKGLELTMGNWMQMGLDFQSTSAFVNCQCGATTEGKNDENGLTIIHSSIACPGFKARFAANPRVRARDHAGWSNDRPDTSPTAPTMNVDDSAVRFGLIEFK